MENFTNNELNIVDLPQFESVTLHRLHSKYRRVLAVNIGIVLLIELIILLILTLKPEELSTRDVLFFWLGGGFIGLCVVWLTFLGFRKKGFAFREHDLIFQYGVIATNTKIIPYNRVQLETSATIWAMRSADGSWLIVVSAKNFGPCLVSITYTPATVEAAVFGPKISITGRTARVYFTVAPVT